MLKWFRPLENLPPDVDATYSVYELTLDGITPSLIFLSQNPLHLAQR
jgi:hypothetical protein